MTVLQSQLSPSSDAYRANFDRMQSLVGEMAEKAALIERGGSDEARERHLKRGKLLPRERLAQLLDVGAPFLEIGQFAAFDMYGGDIASAGLIAGVGRIEGRECVMDLQALP